MRKMLGCWRGPRGESTGCHHVAPVHAMTALVTLVRVPADLSGTVNGPLAAAARRDTFLR